MRKTKKMLVVVLALVMTFSSFAGIGLTVNAEDSKKVKFSVVTDGSTPTVGKRFEMTIRIENADNLNEASVNVKFDGHKLGKFGYSKPRDAEYQNELSDSSFGKINEEISFSSAFSGDTSVYEVWFTPLTAGETEIVISTDYWNVPVSHADDYPESLTYSLDVAPNNTEFAFEVSKDNLKIGDTFDVKVSVKNALFYESMNLEISYNSGLISCVDLKAVDEMTGQIWGNDRNGTAEYSHDVLFPDDYEYGFNGDIDLFIMTFKVLEGGTYTVNVNVREWGLQNQPENATLTINGPATDNYVVSYDKLKYRVAKGEASVISCNSNTTGEIVIPETIDGYPVISIGKNAFSDCGKIKKIILPDSITKIADNSFSNCSSLTEIVLPPNLVSIGEFAFSGCNKLKNITIPAKVSSIGKGAFERCEKMQSFSVDKNNQHYSSDENGVMFNKDKTVLVYYPAGKKDTSYTIPNSVTTIGAYAFKRARNLKNVYFTDNVTSIGEMAFFSTSIESIVIPGSVTKIENYAFSCSGIESMIISEGVTEIPSRFVDASSLKSITIPVSVKKICETAFDVNMFFTDIYYAGTEEQWNNIEIVDFFMHDIFEDVTIHYSSCNEIVIQSNINEISINSVMKDDAFKSAVKDHKYTLADAYGKKLATDALVGTGCIVKLYGSDSELTEMKQIAVKGDINGDGKITTADARLALRGAVGLDNLEGVYKIAADFDGKASVTTSDARMILRKAVGLD